MALTCFGTGGWAWVPPGRAQNLCVSFEPQIDETLGWVSQQVEHVKAAVVVPIFLGRAGGEKNPNHGAF